VPWLNTAVRRGGGSPVSWTPLSPIRECLEVAFGRVGLDWQKYVEIDPRYYRPAEVELLIGDYSTAQRKMGWEPKTKFKDLIELMVDADLADLRK
jgi:GDPmannose 4,6-dehydratase